MVNNGEIKSDGEEINWVRFCKCDLNDQIRNPIFKNENYEAGLIMLLGYNTGIQVWFLQGTNEARELLSVRNGLKCRTAVVLPTPLTLVEGHPIAPRPWLAAVNGAELKIISLRNVLNDLFYFKVLLFFMFGIIP